MNFYFSWKKISRFNANKSNYFLLIIAENCEKNIGKHNLQKMKFLNLFQLSFISRQDEYWIAISILLYFLFILLI